MAFVYRHIRLDSNQPFYIGVGSQEDYTRAYDKHKRNQIWKRIANKHGYKVHIVLDNLTQEEAWEKEKELINLYGRQDLNQGTLCNLTEGGEGLIGHIKTEEHREKLRQANLGKVVSEKTREKLRQANLGKKQSQETIRKRSQSLKGRPCPELAIARLKEYNKNRPPMDDEVREKIRLAKIGTTHSEATKQKMSASQKGKLKNNKRVVCNDTGVEYNSIKEAALAYGIGPTGLNRQILGHRKNKYNFSYITN